MVVARQQGGGRRSGRRIGDAGNVGLARAYAVVRIEVRSPRRVQNVNSFTWLMD